nr:3'-5' exonuclease [Cellulophaga baltica]
MNAVQIMTIHKSKGLEFPIVIYPFANSDIYKEVKPKMWLPVDKNQFNGFENVLINKSQKIVHYNEEVEVLYDDEQQKLELDAFNVLYVALTRAEKNLFIISKKEFDNKAKKPKDKYYSGLFINYLMSLGLWSEQKLEYSFGLLGNSTNKEQENNKQVEIKHQYTYKERSSFKIVTKSGMLWDTTIEAALTKGNTIHHILSLIQTRDDVNNCFKLLYDKGELSEFELTRLKQKILGITEHPQLQEFYIPGNIIKNETDIITKNGTLLRPDRLVINGDNVTIIDYKTGQRSISYKDQVDSYASALIDMGYTIKAKVIVYINENITPEFV